MIQAYSINCKHHITYLHNIAIFHNADKVLQAPIAWRKTIGLTIVSQDDGEAEDFFSPWSEEMDRQLQWGSLEYICYDGKSYLQIFIRI